jgi:fructuronate reductase
MTPMRLDPATCANLPGDVRQPAYDRAAIATGVVHLGVGNFQRAHQALWFDDAIAAGDRRWGIVGASLRSADVAGRLRPQSGLYSVVECDGAREPIRVIGALRDVIVAARDPLALHAALAAPDTHIVTLTVTEKGYGTAPGGAADHLVIALARRRARGLPPFTMLSCDNLAGNGEILRTAVLTVAGARDAALAGWIDAEAAFPASMVDRIVPATTEGDIATFAARTGLIDRGLVRTEPYRQWVIEDRFCGPRPDFARFGATMVADVAPWETAKLRLLNGAHSAIAYLGGLAGHAFVHDAIADQRMAAFIDRLWDESAATLTPASRIDCAAYRVQLAARFANPALAHRTRQIAVDGSQKLPQRLVAPLEWHRVRGRDAPALTLAVAGWMRWQLGRDDAGSAFVVDDPLTAVIAPSLAGAMTADDRVRVLLAIAAIFPPAFGSDAGLVARLSAALTILIDKGAAAAVAEVARR